MVYAKLLGYFWLPCPVCGKHFGGHEAVIGNGLVVDQPDGTQKQMCVCSAECSIEAQRRNHLRANFNRIEINTKES